MRSSTPILSGDLRPIFRKAAPRSTATTLQSASTNSIGKAPFHGLKLPVSSTSSNLNFGCGSSLQFAANLLQLAPAVASNITSLSSVAIPTPTDLQARRRRGGSFLLITTQKTSSCICQTARQRKNSLERSSLWYNQVYYGPILQVLRLCLIIKKYAN